MTTATKITLARVALIPTFMVLFLLGLNWWALAVFIIASLTDLVDGYVARNYHQTSDFGKFLDPLADKLLVFAAMLILVELQRFPAWAVMIVLTREFAVSGLRMTAASKGHVIAAGWSGKVKTAATMIGLCVLIVFAAPWLDITVLAVILVTTIWSGVEYFVKNGSALR
ncbi:MAG: CDP-diacylglycerol--glycerol-3-phosphate 3-phosphatidyltransferase [Oscillospiraceae bacterium]|nr:CDP-diacylglycerol--glycerol-3-phosphate 3-phosphatidyltransferase [Oscillospiraceae bacterium]MBR2896318.1 CDP-diacylglycerol--glycerol-3-phosphate 3-phosphatidyltransferase [Oscillospiraceae bacterium]MBR3850044.1 CDP-diacylglycerol--glycerol-3-phosphate 3-phosphatidyltransferase [Oscillospiraceae bacterium]